jgi:hypothetical protein
MLLLLVVDLLKLLLSHVTTLVQRKHSARVTQYCRNDKHVRGLLRRHRWHWRRWKPRLTGELLWHCYRRSAADLALCLYLLEMRWNSFQAVSLLHLSRGYIPLKRHNNAETPSACVACLALVTEHKGTSAKCSTRRCGTPRLFQAVPGVVSSCSAGGGGGR